MMTVKTKSYNADSAGHDNGEFTEADWTDYTIIARLNEPAESVIILADPTGVKMRKYGVYPKKDLAGAVADDGGVETDETTEASEDTLNDMTLFPVAPLVDDAYYFAFDEAIASMTLVISTAFVGDAGTQTLVWEYSKGADSWDTVAVPALAAMSDWDVDTHTPTWTVPVDWATDEVGSISGKYWLRARLDTVTALDWTTSPLGKRVWTSEVYTGPGRITIDNGGIIYDGRILKSSFDQGSKTVTLHCKDWLSQLDDVVITKEMREDLDGNGLREAEAHSDKDGAFIDVAQNDAGTFYFYDDGPYDDDGARAWGADVFNGMKLVLAASMEGKKTWRFHPYDGDDTGADVYTNDPDSLWTDDDAIDSGAADNDFVIDYDFRVYLGHNTPSDLYIHDTITGARVGFVYKIGGGANNHTHVGIEDKSNPGTYFDHSTLQEDDHYVRETFELNADEYGKIIDANGIASVRFDVDRAGGTASCILKYLYLEVDVETEGYDSTIAITDTINPNKLEVSTDLTAAATRIWEKINYCIVRESYKHIASDETPGDLITNGSIGSGPDPLVVITAAGTVEHTSSFSTRRYENAIRLEVVKDLANIDKVAFFMEIGTTVFTWKSTFNDGAPTAMTDATVLRWTGERSFVDVFNNYILYGPKQNESLLRLDTADISPDPGVDSKSTYGVTRSRTVNNKGVNNLYEITELGTALVERDEDALLFLGCEIAGLSSLRLGDEVSITSTHMGLIAEVYVITEWEFGWRDNITKLRLHPRLSTKGFVPHRIFSNSIRRLGQDTERLDAEVTYEAPEDRTA